MNNNEKKEPQIRFRKYTITWKRCKVSEIFKVTRGCVLSATNVRNEKSIETPYPVYSSQTKENGLMGYFSGYLYEDAITWTTDGANAGTVNYRTGKFYCTNVCGVLLSDKVKANQMVSEAINNIAKRYVSYIGNPKLMNNVMAEITINLPRQADEREQISEYFSCLDNLITFHQSKYEKLVNVKKSMLEKMFPHDGENVPEIRFAGFTEAWEHRKLGEVAEIIGGGTPSTTISEYWDGDIAWYAPAEISDQIYLSSSQRKITKEGFNHSSAKMLPKGTVLFTSRAGIGKTAILCKEGCTNQGFQSIVPYKNKLDSYFIFSRSNELKRYGETVGAGSTFVEVSGKQMANMKLLMPKTLQEQEAVGQYFRNLDNLITLHQQKKKKMQAMKKSMLKNMFI